MARRAAILALLLAVSSLVPARAEGQAYHKVAWGETLYGIARLYQIEPQSLAAANNLPSNVMLRAGQVIKVPARAAAPPAAKTPIGFYTVRAGDTLASIAAQFAVGVLDLARANQIPDNGYIYVGWQLKIPPAPSPATRPAAQIHIVQAGETLPEIAVTYNTTVQAIAIASNLATTWLVTPGQRLSVPATLQPVPAAQPVAAAQVRLTGFPVLRQQQTLTCEEAAAAMALRGTISESRIVAAMPRSENPFLGIRGRTNSPRLGGLDDYGTYAQGLQRGLAAVGRKSTVLYNQSYAAFSEAILAHLRAGRPVIWWNTWRDSYQTPVLVRLSTGERVRLVPYEHAVLLVGFTEQGVSYHDPYDGGVRTITWKTHQRVSGYFLNMALVVH